MAKEKKKNIAQLLKEIEDIVEKLESGDADIDDAIKKYEKGMVLVEACRAALKQSKLKIEKLKKSAKKDVEEEEEDDEESEESGESLF